MKEIQNFIKEAKNQITGIKKVYWEISPNDVHYLGLSDEAVWKRVEINPVEIILKKSKPEEIDEIFDKYTLENGYCVDVIRCMDGREWGGDRRWELASGLPGYRAWSKEKQQFTCKYYVNGNWKTIENDTIFGKNPQEFHKFFKSKFYGPIVVFKIDEYENLVNKI